MSTSLSGDVALHHSSSTLWAHHALPNSLVSDATKCMSDGHVVHCHVLGISLGATMPPTSFRLTPWSTPASEGQHFASAPLSFSEAGCPTSYTWLSCRGSPAVPVGNVLCQPSPRSEDGSAPSFQLRVQSPACGSEDLLNRPSNSGRPPLRPRALPPGRSSM